MIFSILLVAIVLVIILYYKKERVTVDFSQTPEKWRKILIEKVNFYRNLNETDRKRFETEVQGFLSHVKITGVQTEVDLEDRMLIASSAVIPLFGFPNFHYNNIEEVLLYPGLFDSEYNINSGKEHIAGMVGTGVMEGKMILSKPALRNGFENFSDKRNVGIHEFVHLFDKEDGSVDGIPPGFHDKAYALPWLDFARKEIAAIKEHHSDIDEYGATNMQEFFAVASEYFFERPHLLKEKHPKLYELLSQVFHQDMTKVIDKDSFKKKPKLGRNSPCPCGSGKKYKECCGDV